MHPQGVILFFDVTCGDQINDRISRNRSSFYAHLFQAENTGVAPQDRFGL